MTLLLTDILAAIDGTMTALEEYTTENSWRWGKTQQNDAKRTLAHLSKAHMILSESEAREEHKLALNQLRWKARNLTIDQIHELINAIGD